MAQFSDAQIRAYVEANIGDPAAIADAAEAFGISVADLSRATGFSVADVRGYFNNAGVEIPMADNSAAERAAAAEEARQQAANEAAWARQQAENERLWAAQQAENERQWAAQQAETARQAEAAQAKAQADAAAKAQADATKTAGIASLPAASTQTAAPVDKNAAVEKLTQQILAQGTTSQWKGEGFGSAEKNAADMAKILADTGITDISQFGKVTTKVDAAVIPQYESVQKGFDNEGNLIVENKIVGYVDQNGKAVDPSLVKAETVYSGGDAGIFETVYTAPVGTQETFGNKLTGQAVASTYGERQTGNAFGGTYSGEGNTGYRVQFDASGNPIFYTTAASSSDIGDFAPMLAIASFIPGVAPFAQGINALIAAKNGNPLGAIAGIAGLGGYTDVANAANFANAAKSGDILNLALSGANLGGVESIGDYSLPDVSRAINTAKAIQSEDPNALLNIIGSYASNVNNSQPIDTYPETTAPSIFEEKPDTSSITASTQASSLQDILGDSSNQIINNAPFVAAQEVKTTPDYSGQPFSSAFAAARANNDSIFNWNGKAYNTSLAPTVTQPVVNQSTSTTQPPVSDVYPDIRGTAADKAKTVPTTNNIGPYVGYKNAFGMSPTMGDINQVADPRTLAFARGLLGDDTTNKGFSVLHPDIAGIQNAGDVGAYSGFAAQLAPFLKPATNVKSLFTSSSSMDPALERFLEGSVIKDRVFHGTADDISAFSGQFNKATGPGVAGWVTPDASYASRYAAGRPYLEGAETGAMPVGQTFQEGANVIPMYASIRNPLNLDDPNVLKMLKEEIPFLRTPPPGQNWALTMPSQGNYVTDFARQKGYDALQVLDQGYTTYAPLSGTQLKSAISNTGAYNPKDARLGFSEGGVASEDMDEILKIING